MTRNEKKAGMVRMAVRKMTEAPSLLSEIPTIIRAVEHEYICKLTVSEREGLRSVLHATYNFTENF